MVALNLTTEASYVLQFLDMVTNTHLIIDDILLLLLNAELREEEA